MEKIKNFLGSQYKNIILAAFIAMFLAIISILAIKGSFSRYSQDNYCFGYRFRDSNFWKVQITSYFKPAEYNSNRYSLTMFDGLAEIDGPWEPPLYVNEVGEPEKLAPTGFTVRV